MLELLLMFAKLTKPNWNIHGPLLLHVGANIYPYIIYPCQSKETPLVTKVLIGRVHNGWGALGRNSVLAWQVVGSLGTELCAGMTSILDMF